MMFRLLLTGCLKHLSAFKVIFYRLNDYLSLSFSEKPLGFFQLVSQRLWKAETHHSRGGLFFAHGKVNLYEQCNAVNTVLT